MGDGAFTPTAKPMLVPRLERVVELGAAASETCARTSEGKVVCWGGIDRTDAPKPVRVALLP